MNCRPGDLAVILKPATAPQADEVTGLIVTVVERAGYINNMGDSPDGRPVRFSSYDPTCAAWIVHTATPRNDLIDRQTGEVYATRFFVIWDHRLRPIRDPGDDARDETLAWLPAPHKETTSCDA